jgi:hypothetical protein
VVEPIISDPGSQLNRRIGTVVAVVAVLGVIGLVVWGAFALLGGSGGDDAGDGTVEAVATTAASRGGESQTAEEPAPEVPATPAAPVPAPVVPPDLLLSDPTPAIQQLAAAIGAPYRAEELVLYSGYAILDYQDPSATTHIDTRTWREGVVDAPEPVMLPSGFDAEVEADLFDPAEVRFDLVPSLVDQAIRAFPALERAVASHVIIDRFRPFDDRVNLRVYVSDPDRGGGGYARFLADGTFVEVVS